ncbi:MAG: hypothetical protein JRJ48_02570 [Deltaproteobacteria bacterium]|nr:hypothetical protein [Deltaproteobacteria bacterium]
MDKQFLEFWGNWLLGAARGRQQLEDMIQWVEQGFSGFDELSAMFRRFYGLEKLAPDSPQYPQAWQKASENFKTAFNEWLACMQVVPRREHLALEKKYAALKKKAAAQEETIRCLRSLLDEKNDPSSDAVQNVAAMMEKQARQFNDLMESVGKAFQKR